MAVDDVYLMGKDTMNQGYRNLANLDPGRSEDHWIREMFTLKAPVELDTWKRWYAHNLVPMELCHSILCVCLRSRNNF
jgi:hypothetical protein